MPFPRVGKRSRSMGLVPFPRVGRSQVMGLVPFPRVGRGSMGLVPFPRVGRLDAGLDKRQSLIPYPRVGKKAAMEGDDDEEEEAVPWTDEGLDDAQLQQDQEMEGRLMWHQISQQRATAYYMSTLLYVVVLALYHNVKHSV